MQEETVVNIYALAYRRINRKTLLGSTKVQEVKSIRGNLRGVNHDPKIQARPISLLEVFWE